MPLPAGGDVVWPPTHPVVATAQADWDAWYSSDPDRLTERYENRGVRELPENRPSQFRGGVWGRLARWFWGNPTAPGEKRDKLHVPLAGDIARTSSELLFAEPPKLVIGHAATQDRLEELLATGLHPTLLEGGEVCSAIGGAYLRVVWDQDVSDRPWIDTVPADMAVPTFSYGRLRSVIFWRTLEHDGKTVLRHLESHDRGRITHGLYEGTATTLGRPIPLTEHADTAPLAALVDSNSGIDTGAPDHLTASHAPNVRPARAWRNIPEARGLGQSDYQGIEGLMDAVDETYSSWMRDVQDGKSRIIVAQSMLESLGPGQGAAWNEERRIYTGLNMLPRPGDPAPITDVQFAIRVEEHSRTCAELVEQAVRQAGYSPSTFGETGDGAAVTATEIKARERRSMTTRARKALYWGPAIADVVEALLAVEAGPRFRVPGLGVDRPQVEFQDSVSESPKEIAETVEFLKRAEAASRETLVRMVHPDWKDEQVAAEVAKIEDETAMADPTLTGGEGFPPPGQQQGEGGANSEEE
ncbi:phage portal protein [Streptomyces sp. ND04-05B]|uniref:phage portal protein n=1 Tax=Streptomyces sp. ND04-05B TaxID=3028693 RepID=UPI0029A8BD7D|nr:phage portal protein [Streptomyces sp. ND04-05B]MDX3065403.1 phage portal protein [Streptomyces sp. ND04-05B]